MRVKVEFGPGRSRQRPIGFASLLEAINMAHLKQHARSLAPAVVLALQIAVEEGFLQRAAVVGVKIRPMLETMCLQPLFLRGGAHESFEIAAGMQPLAAPIGG